MMEPRWMIILWWILLLSRQIQSGSCLSIGSVSMGVHRRCALQAASSVAQTNELSEKQVDFTMGYLNKHHNEELALVVESYSELGVEMRRRFRAPFKVVDAKLVEVSPEEIELEAMLHYRNGTEPQTKRVSIALDANPVLAQRDFVHIPIVPKMDHAVDDLVRRLNRLFWMIDQPSITGKLIQMGIQIGGMGVGYLKEDLYLNQVPHNRYVRKYFYEMASEACLEAVIKCSRGEISNRMKLVCQFPELNPSMDSYRIGTLLELVRSMAIRLAEENIRVRVCVQGSMGVGIFTGVPKQLNGVATLLQRMDWQSGEGEENEGMVGDFVNFGAIGKEHVVNTGTDRKGSRVEQDDVFILICPQSMVGVDCSIIGPLQDMVDAAGDRPIILVNPDLTDKVSSQGQQSVRGRKQRIEFAESFETIFHFQNLYISGTSYFPILGAMTKLRPSHPWVAHQRRDLRGNAGEVYVPMICAEDKPSGEVLLGTFEK